MAILPAQEALAPSQTTPEEMARQLTMVCSISYSPPPSRKAMAAPAAAPALMAPQ